MAAHRTAKAAHAHAAAVDQTVQGDGLGLGAGGDGVNAALHQTRGADDHGAVALFGLEAGEDCAVFVAEGDGAACRLGAGEVQQDAALAGVLAEVLGHAGRAHGDDRAAADTGLDAVVHGAVAAVGGAGDVDRAARDGEIAVGVQPVAVGVHVQGAARDRQGSAAVAVKAAAHLAAETAAEAVAAEEAHGVGAVAAAGGVETVVAGPDGEEAALNVDDLGLQTLVALADGDGPVRDGEGSVGVDAVVHAGQDQLAAADGDGAARVHRVVIGADAQAAAADRDIGVGGDTLALAAVAGVENDLAALDQNGAAGVQAVLLAQQVQHAAGDGDRALRAVLVVGGVERVGAHVGVQDAALDADAVLAGETLAARLQVHGAALELQVVLGDHGVALQTADVQHTLPAESQVAFGEDGRVHLVLVRLDEFPAGLDQVLAARLGGENQLVGAERVDGRVAAFEDRDAAQDQLDLGILRRVHDDLAVGEGTGEQVIARGGDGDGAAVDLDAAVGAGTAAVAEGDENGVALRLGGGDGGAEGGER